MIIFQYSNGQVLYGYVLVVGGLVLMIGVIGVVFGDIGISLLYMLKEVFLLYYGFNSDYDIVLGVLLLVFWVFNIVVMFKYVIIIMWVDNDGEGGIMVLMVLIQCILCYGLCLVYVVGIFGIFGVLLFFGDGVIILVIFVFGVVEGLEVVVFGLYVFIVLIIVVVLFVVFGVQCFGIVWIGKLFGLIILIWFILLVVIGIWNIIDFLEVFKVFNLMWVLCFFMEYGWYGVFIFGVVVLVVIGGEVLYVDMGYFGVKLICYVWYFFVLLCLVLNYLGQGVLVFNNFEVVKNFFFEVVLEWVLYLMIILVMMVVVIVLQLVIIGVFLVLCQVMQLGYILCMCIIYILYDIIGQIYILGINWGIVVMVIGLVLVFCSFFNLVVVYGILVLVMMFIDMLLLVLVVCVLWLILCYWIILLCVVFFIIDFGFVIVNGVKLLQGVWFLVVFGIVLFMMMCIWWCGCELLCDEICKDGICIDIFLFGLMLVLLVCVLGMVVFLIVDLLVVLYVLMYNFKYNKVLYECNVFLYVVILLVLYVLEGQCLKIELVGDEFYCIYVCFGFMEILDVLLVLMCLCDYGGIYFDLMDIIFFVSCEIIVVMVNCGMLIWCDKLFVLMYCNVVFVIGFFWILGNWLVELGVQVEI